MLHGVCSPFMLTIPTIGFSIAASSSPIARMKARCGVRVSPCFVMSERSFLIADPSVTRPLSRAAGEGSFGFLSSLGVFAGGLRREVRVVARGLLRRRLVHLEARPALPFALQLIPA